MILTLTEEEQDFLVQTVKDYLKDLRIEIWRSDHRQFKARLKHLEEIAQELMNKLGSP